MFRCVFLAQCCNNLFVFCFSSFQFISLSLSLSLSLSPSLSLPRSLSLSLSLILSLVLFPKLFPAHDQTELPHPPQAEPSPGHRTALSDDPQTLQKRQELLNSTEPLTDMHLRRASHALATYKSWTSLAIVFGFNQNDIECFLDKSNNENERSAETMLRAVINERRRLTGKELLEAADHDIVKRQDEILMEFEKL